MISRFYLCDADWLCRKELGAFGVTMDLGVHTETPGWLLDLHTFQKVGHNDPKVTEKGEK